MERVAAVVVTYNRKELLAQLRWASKTPSATFSSWTMPAPTEPARTWPP